MVLWVGRGVNSENSGWATGQTLGTLSSPGCGLTSQTLREEQVLSSRLFKGALAATESYRKQRRIVFTASAPYPSVQAFSSALAV